MDYGTIQTLPQPEFGVHGGTGSATNKEAQRLPMPAMPANESIVQGDKNMGFSDAFIASFKENTLAGLIFDPFSYKDAHFNPDPSFNVNAAVDNYSKFKQRNLDKDEQEFLQGAVSQEDFNNRIERWTQKEVNQKAMQASTAGTLLGAAIDPIDFVIGAGATKLKALSALQQVGVAGATAGAISTALPNTLSDGDVLLNMVGPMIGAAVGTDKPWRKLKDTNDAPVKEIEVFDAPATDLLADTTKQVDEVAPTATQVQVDVSTDPLVKSLGLLDIRSVVRTLAGMPPRGGDELGTGINASYLTSGKAHLVDSVEDIYTVAPSTKYLSTPLDPKAKAVYLPGEDAVVLVRSNLKPEDDVKGILLHEVGVHMNLERFMGTSNYLKLLDDFEGLLSKDPKVKAAFDNVPKDTPQHLLREEALGYFIEQNHKNHKLLSTLISKVRDWLRRLGLKLNYTDNDIVQLIRQAYKNRPDSADVNFPYVWHGSPTKGINQLDTAFIGTGEGRQSFGWGHYVTSEKGTALEYRNKETLRRGGKPEDGGLYRLKVNATHDDLLSWESDVQPLKLRDTLASLGLKGTGEKIYRDLTLRLGSDKAASEYLNSHGIKGIRYKTGKTRHASATNSNYVLFSNDALDMTARYSKAIAPVKTKAEAGGLMSTLLSLGGTLKTWQSFTDGMHSLGPKATLLADKVFGNPWEDKAMSATAYQRNFAADAQRQLKEVENVLTKHGLFAKWDPRPWVRAEYRRAREDVGIQVQQWLHASRKHEMEFGTELPLPTNPIVRDVIETYQKSGFATEMLRRAKDSGLEGAIGKIVPEPVVWDEAVTDELRAAHGAFDGVDKANLHRFSMHYAELMNRKVLPKFYKARKEVNALFEEGTRVDFKQYLKDNTDLSDADIQDMMVYDGASKTWFRSLSKQLVAGENIKDVMKLWRDTYDKLYQKNWDAAFAKAKTEGVYSTRNYLGIVWNYDRVRDFMRRSGKSVDDVAEAFGKQITKTIGHFAGSDAKGIGMQFLKTIQGERTGDLALKFREWELNGLSKEEMVNTLRGAGIPEPEILRAIEQSFGNPNMNSVGDVTKSLRQRLDWDLSEDMGGFTLAEFLEPDIHKTMERYTLEMTSRIGLAKAGFRSGGEFQRALDEAADEAFAAGKSPEEVRRILDHARELALGRPIGDQMPDILRSLTALGSALVLKNSGIYNIGEYAALAAEYGTKRVIREFIPALRKSSIAHMTKQEAEELQDIITGRLVADGRFRPVVSYMEDNFEGTADSIHESIQYSAQSVRFINGSESIRRHQVKIFASLYQKRLEAAINGSAEARDLLIKEGLPAQVLEASGKHFKQYGWQMEQWDAGVLDELSTHALSMADTSVLALRRGERPMLMDTNVGKTIFPFMSFVFAAHNKLLRRQFNRDGVLGVAKIMTYQAPLAVLSAAAANVVGGKDWDADLGNGVPKAMSSLGLATIPWDLIYRGRMGGGFTGFAPINSTVELLSVPDTARGVTDTIPFLTVFPAVGLIHSLYEGEEQ